MAVHLIASFSKSLLHRGSCLRGPVQSCSPRAQVSAARLWRVEALAFTRGDRPQSLGQSAQESGT